MCVGHIMRFVFLYNFRPASRGTFGELRTETHLRLCVKFPLPDVDRNFRIYIYVYFKIRVAALVRTERPKKI
jgi:hypothetical protein